MMQLLFMALSRPRILVIGSSNTDLVIDCPRLPSPGETLPGGEFHRYAGGKGANQAVAAARAGGRVSFLGARGDDDLGRAATAGLRADGIDVRHFAIRKGATSGAALILLGGASKENIIAVAKSANDTIKVEDIRRAEPEIRRSQVVVAQLEVPLAAVRETARIAFASSVPFILNPAPARKLPASLLRHVFLLTPNEHEATHLTGESDLEKAGRKLLAQGCRHVVITLGAQGAMLVDAGGVQRFSAPKVKVRDTVGAGDCFTGWLAVGVGEGLSIPDAIRRALVAASLAVTRPGAQSGMPQRDEVLSLLAPKKKPLSRKSASRSA